MAFLLMGAFVTVYNYLGFRLLAPPFSLPGTLVGLVFLGYLAGSWASTGAGRLGDRFGRRPVLWVATLLALAGIWVTLPDLLPTTLAGLLLVTVGFFGAHSVASSWVGRRSATLPGRCRPRPRRCTWSATTPGPASAVPSEGRLRPRRLGRGDRLRQRAAAGRAGAGARAAPDPGARGVTRASPHLDQ